MIIIIVNVFILCLCVEGSTPAYMNKPEDNLWELVLTFYRVNLDNSIWLLRVDRKHLNFLSYFVNYIFVHFFERTESWQLKSNNNNNITSKLNFENLICKAKTNSILIQNFYNLITLVLMFKDLVLKKQKHTCGKSLYS